MYGCKIQNLKVGSVPAAYPADCAITAKHCDQSTTGNKRTQIRINNFLHTPWCNTKI